MGIDATAALVWSARLGGIGLLFQSLELASLRRELRAGHLLGWETGAPRRGFARVLQRAWTDPACQWFLLGRAMAAAGVVLLAGTAAASWLLGSLVLGQFYYSRRFHLISTNADHMNLVVLAACAVGLWPDASTALRMTALGFMAFQAGLAYVASGIDKARAPGWRQGARVVQVFQDSAHRFRPLGNLLAARPPLARFFSWVVMIGEMLFPLGLLLPRGGFLAVLAAGVTFHLAIAVTMGLPGFFWAFVATYPALYFVFERLHAAIGG